MTLAAINYERLSKLESLTQNHLQAKLLDRFVYWWQYSRYTLNDNQKWFTRNVKDMAEATKISERSIARYMKKFEDMGLIERRCVLFKKKNLFIRITQKLLALLNNDTVLPETGSNNPAPLAVSYIRSKEQIVKTNSTISDTGIVNNSDELIKTPTAIEQTKKPNNSENLMDKLIGEGITQRCANYIKAVINNVCQSTKDAISNPSKLYAEIVYAITNPEHHFKNAESFEHKMNIVSKLLRRKQWTTPKGFYNHCEAGQHYRDKENIRQNKVKQHKQAQKTRDEALNDQLSDLPFENAQPTALKNNQEIYQAKKELSALSIQIREIITEINSIKRTNALFESSPDKSGYAETLRTNTEMKAKYDQELLELQQQHKSLREIIERWAE